MINGVGFSNGVWFWNGFEQKGRHFVQILNGFVWILNGFEQNGCHFVLISNGLDHSKIQFECLVFQPPLYSWGLNTEH